MDLVEVTAVKIECLEELLHNNKIGILSKKIILEEIEKLKNYYAGLVNAEENYYDDEDDNIWEDEEDEWWEDDD